MSEQLNEDLIPFRTIILSLISYAMHPKLDTLIEKLTPNEIAATRFLIKVEIKRLARPCPYVLDFRSYFDDCEKVHHNNICHYLDEISKTLFLDSVEKNNGLFSMSLFNEINTHAKQRHIEKVKQENALKALKAGQGPVPSDPLKTFTLINDNFCQDPIIDLESKCRIFTYDPLGMSRKGKEEIGLPAILVDLNLGNCVLKADYQAIDEACEDVFLWFYDHSEHLGIEKEIVLQYHLEDFKHSKGKKHTQYRLKLNKSSESKMINQLSELLTKKVQCYSQLQSNQIQPLIDSILAKSHEQFFMAKSPDIAMLCTQHQTVWYPSCGLHTKSNEDLWQFFSCDSVDNLLPNLFTYTELQAALSAKKDFDQYAYILKHQYHENEQPKAQFIILWQSQLTSKKAQELLKKYILNGNYRHIRLKLTTINAQQDAYNPSALPSHINPVLALLNRPINMQVNKVLTCSNYFAQLSDVTDINEVLALKQALKVPSISLPTTQAIKCPVRYQLPIIKAAVAMEQVEVKVNDFRSEDRFDYALTLRLTRHGKTACKIAGVTNNISTKGLSIALDEPLACKAGVEVRLSMDIPYRNRVVTIANQVYQLVGCSDHKNLRLLIGQTERRHAASYMLREFIYQNMDNLKPSGLDKKETYGLEQALRNVYAKNHFSVPFFIHQDKRQWFISSVAMNQQTQINSLNVDSHNDKEMLVKLIEQEKFRNYCMSVINKVDKKTPIKSFYLIVLPRNLQDKQKQMFWFNDLAQLQNSGHLVDVIEKIRLLGKPTILRIQVLKPARVMDKYFRDELQYLAQIASRKADDVLNTIEGVCGLGEISDQTEHVLALIDQYLLKPNSPALAVAS